VGPLVGLTIEFPESTGSGDGSYSYVLTLCFVAVAAAVAAVWSLVSRRTEHERLYDWVRVYVRFFLAWVVLGYGFQKVFKLHFTILVSGD
jgi:hypothetical protein